MKNEIKIGLVLIVGGMSYWAYQLNEFQTVDVPKIVVKRTRVQKNLNERDQELIRLRQFVENIQSIKQELREMNLQYETALESMPRSFNLSDLLRKLNLLCQNSGVELVSYKPGSSNDTLTAPGGPGAPPSGGALPFGSIPPGGAPSPTAGTAPPPGAVAPAEGAPNASPAPASPESFYATTSVQLEIKGGFTQTLSFLDQVSRMKRIVHVQGLKMKRAPAAGEKNVRSSTVPIVADVTIEAYRFKEN